MFVRQITGLLVILIILFIFSFAIGESSEQNNKLPELLSSNSNQPSIRLAADIPIKFSDRIPPENYIPKKPGIYTRDDWSAAIDATWGTGLPDTTKLRIFTEYWNYVDEHFACFDDLDFNIWDMVWNTYYPEIASGTSAGRFCAILNYASMALHEGHTRARDLNVYSTELSPGTPLMYLGSFGPVGHFGAALTPLPDSTLLVYNAVENHPLGLLPGDKVLGYDGIPWKELYPQLLSAEIPLTGWGWGSSESAFSHIMLSSAGMNWHLFDIIDIEKYPSGEVFHFPTSLLESQEMELMATEQLDIEGIPIPDIDNDQLLNYGIIPGTEIGYINVVGWWSNAGSLWENAINDLMTNHETIGLIVDFRFNVGGNMWLAYPGLEILFNEEVRTVGFAGRYNLSHLKMKVVQSPDDYPIRGEPDTFYDKPIGVLTGPATFSSGDQIALALAFHPMVKYFGKPTNGAFNAPAFVEFYQGFKSLVAKSDAYLNGDYGHFLSRDEFPSEEDFPWVDYENTWFTQEGVAQGKDDVVEAAINWILSRDIDQDGYLNENDNCPMIKNSLQEDFDNDGVGEVCDNCPGIFNPIQYDFDENGIGDACQYVCGDFDEQEGITILDVVYLINFKYKGGPDPVPMVTADVNSDESIDILDAVYLVNFKYKNGPDPVCLF